MQKRSDQKAILLIDVFFFQNAPYIMLKETAESLTGNDRFEGYSVDLIHAISEILGNSLICALLKLKSMSCLYSISNLHTHLQ